MLFTTADDLKLFSVFNKHFADRFLYTNLPWLVHRISSELSWDSHKAQNTEEKLEICD